jgi:hypothetical protein
VTTRSARRELDDYVEALRRRQRAATCAEFEKLRLLSEAADREYQWKRDRLSRGLPVGSVPKQPPAWELLELEFKPVESEQTSAAPDAASVADQVLSLLARKQQPSKEKPGPKLTPVDAKIRRRVAELRDDGATVAEIMRQTKLTKTIATRLVRDVDDALGTIRAGRY